MPSWQKGQNEKAGIRSAVRLDMGGDRGFRGNLFLDLFYRHSAATERMGRSISLHGIRLVAAGGVAKQFLALWFCYPSFVYLPSSAATTTKTSA